MNRDQGANLIKIRVKVATNLLQKISANLQLIIRKRKGLLPNLRHAQDISYGPQGEGMPTTYNRPTNGKQVNKRMRTYTATAS